jgi:Flp pilus assembly protein TadB
VVDGAEGWALAAAVAFVLGGSQWAAWESAVLAVAGALTGQPLVACAGLIAGVGLGRLSALAPLRRALDRQDAATERFLERLRFVAAMGLPVAPSIELALAGSGRDRGVQAARSRSEVQDWVDSLWPHPVLRRARPIWAVLDRHGGPLAEVAAALLAEVRLERQLRWDLDQSLAGPLSTVSVLAWSPAFVLTVFRWIVPPFYAELTHTPIGELCLLVVAASTAVVTALAAALARPVRGGRPDHPA